MHSRLLFFCLFSIGLIACNDPRSLQEIHKKEGNSASTNEPSKALPFKDFLDAEDYWNDRMNTAFIFQKDRKKLHQSFPKEVLKLAEGNKERCYWLALFLTDDYYLDDTSADVETAIKITDHGLTLISPEGIESSRCDDFSALYNAAVFCVEQNRKGKAGSYRRAIDSLEKSFPYQNFNNCIPAKTDEQSATYENIIFEPYQVE